MLQVGIKHYWLLCQDKNESFAGIMRHVSDSLPLGLVPYFEEYWEFKPKGKSANSRYHQFALLPDTGQNAKVPTIDDFRE